MTKKRIGQVLVLGLSGLGLLVIAQGTARADSPAVASQSSNNVSVEADANVLVTTSNQNESHADGQAIITNSSDPTDTSGGSSVISGGSSDQSQSGVSSDQANQVKTDQASDQKTAPAASSDGGSNLTAPVEVSNSTAAQPLPVVSGQGGVVWHGQTYLPAPIHHPSSQAPVSSQAQPTNPPSQPAPSLPTGALGLSTVAVPVSNGVRFLDGLIQAHLPMAAAGYNFASLLLLATLVLLGSIFLQQLAKTSSNRAPRGSTFHHFISTFLQSGFNASIQLVFDPLFCKPNLVPVR